MVSIAVSVSMSVCSVSEWRISSMSMHGKRSVTISQMSQTSMRQGESVPIGTVKPFRRCERGHDEEDGNGLDHDDSLGGKSIR